MGEAGHLSARRAINKQIDEISRISTLTGEDLLEAVYTRAVQRPFVLDDTIFVNGEKIPYTLNPNRGTTTSGVEAERRRQDYDAYVDANRDTAAYQHREHNAQVLLRTVADMLRIDVCAVYSSAYLPSKRTKTQPKPVTAGSVRNEDALANKIADMLEDPEIERKCADKKWVGEILKNRKSPSFDALNRANDIDRVPYAALSNVVTDDYTANSIIGMTPEIQKYFDLKEAIDGRSQSKLETARAFGFANEKALDRWMDDVERTVLIDLYSDAGEYDSDDVVYAGPDDVIEPLHPAYLAILAEEFLRDERERQERERDAKPLEEMTPKERRNKRDRDKRTVCTPLQIVRRTPKPLIPERIPA